ncbi:MAG: 2-oxoacid:acceptor oxidoreductase family protein [Sulfuricella sp.]|nr:2-oxoacid:acceptor oxidoreductase family protein [Sulfuricella sp.]
MIEIRIHGRGGQGNVAAAYILASAAFQDGRHSQAFPNFGAERRGAPVTAFVRIAEQPFSRRCQVLNPAFLIVQDEALLHIPGVTDGLLAGGGILVNSTSTTELLREQTGLNIVALSANALARKILGRPVPNTALLSAFLSLTGMISIDALVKGLEQRFKGEVLDRNTQLVNEAAQLVQVGLWKEINHAANA